MVRFLAAVAAGALAYLAVGGGVVGVLAGLVVYDFAQSALRSGD